MFPVAGHTLPAGSDLIPAIGNPVSAPVLEYIVPGNPGVRVTAPIPVTRCPDITLARRRGPLIPRRRRCHFRFHAGSCRSHARGGHCARIQAQRDQQSPAYSPHFPDSYTFSPLTTQNGVSKTLTMLHV